MIEMNTTHIELPLVQNNVQIIVQLILLSKKLILCYNAALSGEQRIPPNLNHCAVNTKVELNQKCRALGIRLKCFVSSTLLNLSAVQFFLDSIRVALNDILDY
ncbi:hypothetical protein F7Y47_24245 [Vibrio sp. 1-2-3a]|nr:hypothetical protein [Vibrio sp. 2-1-2a]MDU9605446.1 hypothetical protein [Vibrio sp. 1-2-3a]